MTMLSALVLASLPFVGMSPDIRVMSCQFPATEHAQFVELNVRILPSLADPEDRTAMRFQFNEYGPFFGQVLKAPLPEDRNVLLRASLGPDFLFVAAVNFDGSAVFMPYDLTSVTFAEPISQTGRCERHEQIVQHWGMEAQIPLDREDLALSAES